MQRSSITQSNRSTCEERSNSHPSELKKKKKCVPCQASIEQYVAIHLKGVSKYAHLNYVYILREKKHYTDQH